MMKQTEKIKKTYYKGNRETIIPRQKAYDEANRENKKTYYEGNRENRKAYLEENRKTILPR